MSRRHVVHRLSCSCAAVCLAGWGIPRTGSAAAADEVAAALGVAAENVQVVTPEAWSLSADAAEAGGTSVRATAVDGVSAGVVVRITGAPAVVRFQGKGLGASGTGTFVRPAAQPMVPTAAGG